MHLLRHQALIGRNFDDPIVKRRIVDIVPYKITRAPNGDAWVKCRDKAYAPAESPPSFCRR
ncbi:MAG: Hsp70 family protein [Terricaulis sp.]